jgi:hypothetical protein
MKLSLSAILGVLLATGVTASPAFAFDMPGLPGGLPQMPQGDSAETTAIKADTDKLVIKTHNATVQLLSALVSFHQATGNKAAQEAIGPILAKLAESKPEDLNALRAVSDKLSLIGDSVSPKAALSVALVQSPAFKTKLTETYQTLGAAGSTLMGTSSEATDIGKRAAGLMGGAIANPLQLAGLKPVADTGMFLGQFVPNEVSCVRTLASSMQTYATQAQVTLPSLQEIMKDAGIQ